MKTEGKLEARTHHKLCIFQSKSLISENKAQGEADKMINYQGLEINRGKENSEWNDSADKQDHWKRKMREKEAKTYESTLRE